jgi:hypothetical protein
MNSPQNQLAPRRENCFCLKTSTLAAVLQIQRKLVSKALTIVFTGNTVIYALAPRLQL